MLILKTGRLNEVVPHRERSELLRGARFLTLFKLATVVAAKRTTNNVTGCILSRTFIAT